MPIPHTVLHRHLSALDAAFLDAEKPKEPLHIGSCSLYAGHLSRDTVIQTLLSRLPFLPRYRQKVVFPASGWGHPTWEDDPDFDIHHHIEELTLPAPGNDEVLSEVGGRVFACRLDRGRPLWKMILLRGRPDNNTLLISMVHHAMADGLSHVALTMAIHDLNPDTQSPVQPPPRWQPRPPLDPFTRLQDTAQNWWAEVIRQGTDESLRLLQPTKLCARVRQLTPVVSGSLSAVLQQGADAPFNGPLCGERQFAWTEFSSTALRSICARLGGSIHAVDLAIIAGGMRRYLQAHDYQTESRVLTALCPVSMRHKEERQALGNRVSMVIAPLYVGIIDPGQRVAAERAAIERLKRQQQAALFSEMLALSHVIPPPWHLIAGQLPVTHNVLNTICTSIPGPHSPLYLAGHKLLSCYPLGPVGAGIGLCHAILRYDQKRIFCATVDKKIVPDVWFYMACLRESFTELLQAAEGKGTPAS